MEARDGHAAVRRSARPAASLGMALVAGSVLATAGGAAGATSPGWGPTSNYVGRYHVTIESASGASAKRIEGGELTLFMRLMFKGKPLIPSGILDLRGSGEAVVVYLTDLQSSGDARRATLNGGAFVGPSIGSFAGRGGKPGVLSGTATVRGLGTVRARFVRFSSSAQP